MSRDTSEICVSDFKKFHSKLTFLLPPLSKMSRNPPTWSPNSPNRVSLCWASIGFGDFLGDFEKIELSRGSERVRRPARALINAENHGESIGDSFRSIPECLEHQNIENHDFPRLFSKKVKSWRIATLLLPWSLL